MARENESRPAGAARPGRLFVSFHSTRAGYREGPLLGPYKALVMTRGLLTTDDGAMIADFVVRSWLILAPGDDNVSIWALDD